MPITTFQTILSTDKLQSGFRAKFNADVALLITDITDNGDGTATVELQGGTNFQIDLGTSFYTKAEVVALVGGITPATWGAITGNVADQTDVVGNFGVISPIGDILISCNFAVGAADADNPFFGSPASGYASFSIPGIAGTGWQLLIKEGAGSEIKYRNYYSGVWHAWQGIQQGASDYKILAGSPYPAVLTNGVEFSTTALLVVVQQLISKSATANTNDGSGIVFDIEYTDSTKTVIDYLTVYTTTADGVTVDVDTWVRVV